MQCLKAVLPAVANAPIERKRNVSLLASISRPESRPPIITIAGDAGTGKTSLAASFPKPIVIRAEDGLGSIPYDQRPDAFPLLQSADELWEQVKALLNEDHDYKTVIIDSVTALDPMFTSSILAQDGRAKTLATALGGYGAGFQALAGMHSRLRKGLGFLNERKGMAVVFVAHADLETMRLPDVDDYSRYSLRLNAKSLPPYIDDVDLVGFVRLAAVVRGDEGERKKVISNGDRELICHATAASIAKNRFGITEAIELPVGENPLLPIIWPEAAKPKLKMKLEVEHSEKEVA